MKIQKAANEQFRRIKDNPIVLDQSVKNYLTLHEPKDLNGSGENLLTIYLNETFNFKYLTLFMQRDFKIQPDKLKSEVLDTLITEFFEKDRQEDFLKLIPKNPSLFFNAMSLPTRYKKELFDLTYQKDEKINLIDVFFLKPIALTKDDNVHDIIKEHLNIIHFLYHQNAISQDELNKLVEPKNIQKFNQYFFDAISLPATFNSRRRQAIREMTGVNKQDTMYLNLQTMWNVFQSKMDENMKDFKEKNNLSLSQSYLISFISMIDIDESIEKKRNYKKL